MAGNGPDISIAFDLGNSGGKVYAATMDSGRLEILDELVISNELVRIGDRLYWDLFRIFRDFKEAVKKCAKMGRVVSIAVDGTSGAFAFVNRAGTLGSYITTMRSMDSTLWKTETEAKMSLQELYDRTGVFPMGYNVLSRLTAEFASGELSRGINAQFASITSLFEFLLTGQVRIERSMAGATVLMDPEFRDWNRPLLETLGIPTDILPEIVPPGTVGAPLLPKLAEELGCPDCRFIHTVEFDSAAAMVSAPGLTKEDIYLSMGSTINPGVQLDHPVISDDAREYRYKNAPVWPGSVMLMSDVPGFFILQECLDLWKKTDPSLGHGELVELARASKADAVMDLFDPRFSTTSHDVPGLIRAYCSETGQNVPETIGDVARVLYLSYASAIAWSIDKLKKITGKSNYRRIIAVSGGSRNALLCQMIADASGMAVRAGDPKATCLGNLLVQFYALGRLDSYEAMQAEAERFCEMKDFAPAGGK